MSAINSTAYFERHFMAVLAAENCGQPTGAFRERDPSHPIGPEVDEWISPPWSEEICTLLEGGEDFAYADEMHQRFFLILAAEVLYGPNRDARLLAEAVMLASEPA